jgi:hypothetical protein
MKYKPEVEAGHRAGVERQKDARETGAEEEEEIW